MAAWTRAATVGILLFLTKVTLAGSSAAALPRLPENDCVVHTLPIEVLQQLIASAEVTLKNSGIGTTAHPEAGTSDAALDGSATHILLLRIESELTELRRKMLSLEAEVSQMKEGQENGSSTSYQQEINISVANQVQLLQEETRQVKDQLSVHVQQFQEETRQVKDQLSGQVQQFQEETRQVKDQQAGHVQQLQEETRQVRDQLSGQVQLLQEETRQVKDQLADQVQQLQEEVKNQLLGLSQQVTQALQVPVATSGRELETRSDLDTRPRDCCDLLRSGRNKSGTYTIYPQTWQVEGMAMGSPLGPTFAIIFVNSLEETLWENAVVGVDVWCDMGEKEVGEGGWTVVLLRRPLGTQVNFTRGWHDYAIGFGSPDTEYWIGNDVLHALTNGATQVLRVDMTDWDGESRYAQYSSFHVADRDHDYRLRLGTVSGTAGDALKNHDNMLFSTPDRDNDIIERRHCADEYHSGFWFYKCYTVSPTNPLLYKQKSVKGITCDTFHSDSTTLQSITFKVKPAICNGR
ncbi:fibrinogen-like protein 1 [Macrobrachium rosenbergii]|uniref:fibrinogen-like protein 1 n=1 Tax=Macrobrachium rosenbergii TaxID=79674 RepID=UPI0034D6EA09